MVAGFDAWPASPLWDYATALYATPGVAEACLALQDRRGADVNLLLLACWLGATGREPRAERLAEARARAEAWQRELVRPLRQARRRLKAELAGLPEALREPLAAARADLTRAELALERGELLFLEEATGADTGDAGRNAPVLAIRILRHLVAFDSDDEAEIGTLVAAAFPGRGNADAVSVTPAVSGRTRDETGKYTDQSGPGHGSSTVLS